MYLMILEDGEAFKQEGVSALDLSSADDGILDILDITDPNNPTRYWDSKWLEIETFEYDGYIPEGEL